MDAMGYTQISAGCLLTLLVLLCAQLKTRDKSMPALLFTVLLGGAIALTVVDFACGLNQLDALAELELSYAWNAGSAVLFYMLAQGCCFVAFLYAEAELGQTWLGSRKRIALSAVPLAVFWVLLFLPRGGRMFPYLDAAGLRRSGWDLLLLLLGGLLYLAALAGHCMWQLSGGREEKTSQRKLRDLLVFTLGPLAGMLLQIGQPGRALLCMGLTLGLLYVYITIQQNKITVDTLTGISNRAVLLRYLENELPYYRRHPNKSLYFLMMDLDHFKQINDQYGHLEGDAALVVLARTLKKVCANYNCVLARYGGDEFCIACGCDIVGVRTLIASIKRGLIEANEASGKPYKIEISIGCAKFKPEINTVHDLIDKADQEMYLLKIRKKSAAKAGAPR